MPSSKYEVQSFLSSPLAAWRKRSPQRIWLLQFHWRAILEILLLISDLSNKPWRKHRVLVWKIIQHFCHHSMPFRPVQITDKNFMIKRNYCLILHKIQVISLYAYFTSLFSSCIIYCNSLYFRKYSPNAFSWFNRAQFASAPLETVGFNHCFNVMTSYCSFKNLSLQFHSVLTLWCSVIVVHTGPWNQQPASVFVLLSG